MNSRAKSDLQLSASPLARQSPRTPHCELASRIHLLHHAVLQFIRLWSSRCHIVNTHYIRVTAPQEAISTFLSGDLVSKQEGTELAETFDRIAWSSCRLQTRSERTTRMTQKLKSRLALWAPTRASRFPQSGLISGHRHIQIMKKQNFAFLDLSPATSRAYETLNGRSSARSKTSTSILAALVLPATWPLYSCNTVRFRFPPGCTGLIGHSSIDRGTFEYRE